jgi:hypothetical protein
MRSLEPSEDLSAERLGDPEAWPASLPALTTADDEIYLRLASWLADVAAETASRERAGATPVVKAERLRIAMLTGRLCR